MSLFLSSITLDYVCMRVCDLAGFSKMFFALASRSNTSPHRRHVAESLLHANEELSAKYGSESGKGR